MLENRRKVQNYFVDTKAQIRLAVPFFVLLTVSCGLIIYLFIMISSLLGMYVDEVGLAVWAEVSETNVQVFWVCAGGVACLGLLCGVLWLNASHRIFGPMVKIQRHIDDLMAGRYDSRIQLRRFDEFQDLAEQLNQLSVTLQQKKSSL